MSGIAPCPLPPLESTEEALQNIQVRGLVIRINSEHLADLEEVAAGQAIIIASIKRQQQNNPASIMDDFTRLQLAPRDIIVYGAVETLPADNHKLALKYLNAGRRVSLVTALTPAQVRAQMSMEENGSFGQIYMDSLHIKLSDHAKYDSPHHIFALTDKRRVCEIPYTTQFGEVARAATHSLMGHAVKRPCETCLCPRKGPSPV